MKRREFLKALSGASLVSSLPWWMQSVSAAETSPWAGMVIMSFHANGGLDQSSWTDPRNDTAVNGWASTGSAGVAGRLAYAPLGNNADFFSKYQNHILAFNGVDLQSNSHRGGTTHQHTGKLSDGYPSLPALHAAINGQGLPLPWVVMGGQTFHANIQAFTRLDYSVDLRTLANPNRRDDFNKYVNDDVLEVVNRYRVQRLQAFLDKENNLPFTERKLKELYDARANRNLMENLANAVPSTFDFQSGQGNDRLKSDVHKALVMFKAGTTVAASMRVNGGWDTHGAHDDKIGTLVGDLGNMLDYVWTKAEEVGIAERLLVHVTTDVGRRPYYNTSNGKDHWQTSTAMFMAKNAPWANRTVGMTGPAHERVYINPQTLQSQPEDEGGELLLPSHVQRAGRQILGIENHPLALKYPLSVPQIDVLNPGAFSPVNTG